MGQISDHFRQALENEGYMSLWEACLLFCRKLAEPDQAARCFSVDITHDTDLERLFEVVGLVDAKLVNPHCPRPVAQT
jgi:hypothetical protein